MNRQKLIGVICGAPLALASCATAGLEQAAPAGPSFPISEAPTWAGVPDDGFNRLVLDLTAGGVATESAGPSTPEPTPETADRTIDDQAHLYNDENGDLWALLSTGERVRVELSPDGIAKISEPTAAPVETMSTEQPATDTKPAVVATLEADPRIEMLVDLGDGTWAVVTTMTADELVDLTGHTSTPDARMAVSTNDPYYSDQWSLENVGTEGVAGADVDFEGAIQATDGAGVVVAVVDTGVDFGHPDLLANRWENPGETSCTDGVDNDANGFIDDCHGWDFADGDPTGYDPSTHWHGTHVAGTIAAEANNGVGIAGLAPGVQIMDLRVMGNSGTSASIVAAAIRYAVDNGARVVNLSLGTQPGAVPASAVTPLADAIEYANLNDVVVVAAAGNDSTNIDSAPVWPASLPHANLVTVGSSTWYDSISGFSNTGKVAVDLFAPGSRILATDGGGGYRIADGTSMATPHVAAGAALVLAVDPGLDAQSVRDRLLVTADAAPAFTNSAVSGARLNASNAAWDGVVPPSALTFTGFSDLTPDEAFTGTISVEVVQPEAFGDLDVTWEGTLLTRVDGVTLGVLGHPMTTSAGSTTSSATTASFALSGTVTPSTTDFTLGTTLPEGDYALVVEAVPAGHPGLVIGDPQVLFFAVGDPTPPTPSPAPETGGGGAGGGTTTTTTATTAPPGGGTGGSGSSGTTTTAPPGGNSGGGTSGDTTTTTTATTAPPGGGTGGSGSSGTTTTAPPGGNSGGGTSGGTTTTTTTAGGGGTGGSGGGTGASPTTTTPSGGTGSPPTTAQSGQWRIDSVSPGSGALAGGGYITIDGNFPQPPFVWIGDQLANVLVVGSDELLVLVPGHTEAGPVDISLRTTGGGEVLRAVDVYTYIGPTTPTTAPSGGSTPTTAPSGGGSGDAGGGATTTTTTAPGGSGGGGTDIGTPLPVEDPAPAPAPGGGGTTPTTTAPGGSGGGETPPVAPGARSRLHMSFGATQTVGSLTLAPVSGGDPFEASDGPTWANARCSTEPCRPRRA
ncbi:MAG: S8 family serine peptidase [Actinomycetia bacterium]|nr:S8 family serine peptidase [Actinomycetes bacterium]